MRMGEPIPSQCPDCGAIAIEVTDVPPSEHRRGDEWKMHAKCTECDAYDEWID